jgi:flagellar basal-body rod protein FlgB
MFIDQLSNAGAMPALEMTMRFAAQRQRLIAHNIANLDTPNFIQNDVSVGGFQNTLDKAIRQRRSTTGGMRGDLSWRETRELGRDRDGGLRLTPQTPSGGVLYHDRNNRDVERLMQSLAETTGVFRTAAELYRSQKLLLDMAISQRV